MNEGIRLKVEERRVEIPSGTGRKMIKGDRMCVRMLFSNGQSSAFISSEVSDMTELLAQVRRHCHGRRGLMRLFIRNASRGWSFERPMMLYSEDEERTMRLKHENNRYLNSRRAYMGSTPISGHASVAVGPVASSNARPRMLMPWETH